MSHVPPMRWWAWALFAAACLAIPLVGYWLGR
jgi:hypothetical protein